MRAVRRWLRLAACALLPLVSLVPARAAAEAPPRAPLDALWQEHMLAGTAATIYAEGGGQRNETGARNPFDEQRGVVASVESAASTTYGIAVLRLDERWLLWRNGGWVLQGGLLARARERGAAVELYGKAVIRRPPWISWGPFRRDPPMTTGYEFFLLQRRANAPRATVVRQWTVEPDGGARLGRVGATLRYDPATRTARVAVSGLKKPIDASVGPLPPAD